MSSFNVILLFALFSDCTGTRSNKLIDDGKNYTIDNQEENWMNAKDIYAFTVKDIEGNDVPMSIYRNKVLLIVNVASKCGLTNINYKLLVALHYKYNVKGLVILAFPCNQIMRQEPDSNAEIAEFAKKKGVRFPMFSKIKVNGDNASPLWKYLKLKTKTDGNIAYSFTKFVVNRKGHVIKRVTPVSALRVQKVLSKLFRN